MPETPSGIGYCPACGVHKADLRRHAKACLNGKPLTPEAWDAHMLGWGLRKLFNLISDEAIYTVLSDVGVRRELFPFGDRWVRNQKRYEALAEAALMVLSWREEKANSAPSVAGAAPLAEVEP